MAFGPAGSSDPLAPLQGELGPLYFLYGKDSYLVERATDLLKARVLEPSTAAFNQDLFDGKEADAGKIVQAARTVPMMAKRRLVLVRRADEIKADELATLAPYVSAPIRETCLVFVGEKIDQRLKFFTAFKKHGQLIKLDPLPERALPGYVEAEGKRRDIRFAPGAAQLLADEIGAQMGALTDAVERLSIFVAGRPDPTIQREDVEQLTTSSRQRSVFELSDAIFDRRRADALRLLGVLAGQREPAVRLVFMLARQLRQVWTTRQLVAERYNGDLASRIGVPPFVVQNLRAQARRLDEPTLQRMHAALWKSDKQLKSSRLDEQRILEVMILEMTE